MKSLVLAWQGIRSEPLKALLTVVALTLGLLGVVSVVAAQGVLSQAVAQRALAQGGPVATFSVSIGGVDEIAEFELAADQLAARTGAIRHSLMVSGTDIELRADGAPVPQIEIRFVDDSLWDIRRSHVTQGQGLPASNFLSPRMLLNVAALKSVSPEAETTVHSPMRGVLATVLGIIDDGENSGFAYLPLSAVPDFLSSQDISPRIILSGGDLTAQHIQAAGSGLRQLGAPYEIKEVSRTDTVETLRRELEATSRVLLALGVLSLISAVAAVATVGLSTARGRSREYALRRTLGASRLQIAIVTVLESQIVAFVAAVMAALVSYLLFPLIIGLFSPPAGLDPPSFSFHWAAFAVLLASVSALVASMLPALVVFRRDNSVVMRE